MFFLVILILISIVFTGCNTPQYTIDSVKVDGVKFDFMVSMKISGKSFIDPSILITENRKPTNASDGKMMKGYSFLYETNNSEIDKLYFTLVNREKFISSPYEFKIDKSLYTLNTPDIDIEFKKGDFFINAFTGYASDLSFNFTIDGKEYFGRNNQIQITPESTTDINGSCYVVDPQTNEKSQRVFFTFIQPPNEAPTVDILSEIFDKDNSIEVFISDDYDKCDELTINATCNNTPCFFNGGKLYSEFPLEDGLWPLMINVIDSSGKSSFIKENVYVKNIPSEDIPVLFIEEGAARKARWNSSGENNILQLYKNNSWKNITTSENDSDRITIQNENISDEGDVYRLISYSGNKRFFPSVPVFAAESFYKRYSSNTILSLFGANTFLPGFQEYKISSNIAIPFDNILKIDNGASVNLAMGSTILLSGVLDIEGKDDRVKFFSNSYKNSIEVNNGGVLIARGVNFQNINLKINDGAIVVLFNCDFIDGSIKIEKANTVYFYNSKIKSDITLKNIDELNIYKSSLSDETIQIENSYNTNILASEIRTDNLEFLSTSKGNIYESEIVVSNLLFEGNVFFQMYDTKINSDKIELKKSSTIIAKNTDIEGKKITLHEISMIKTNKNIQNAELGGFSDITVYEF